LWSETDVVRLLTATRQLRLRWRAATYEALFGLIAATGMFSGDRPCGGVSTIR